ncbi:hypothetical protein QYF36_005144 [Acer negundo]|nr:hypothetical protein QYF36_005144 [Acer negundo]
MKNSLIFNSTLSLRLVRWNQSTDCCTWSGVDCDMAGHVIGLDLSEESIYGGIDNSTGLFALQHLRSLNLASNLFDEAQIPSRLANLTNLTYLNLSDAGFVGQIPIEISSLTRLPQKGLTTWEAMMVDEHKAQSQLKQLQFEMDLFPEIPQYKDSVTVTTKGNEGLYGPPLTNDVHTTNSNELPAASSNEFEFDWQFIIAIGAGFGTGFGAAVASPTNYAIPPGHSHKFLLLSYLKISSLLLLSSSTSGLHGWFG